MSFAQQIYQYTVNDNFSYHIKEKKLVDSSESTEKTLPHVTSHEVDDNE